MGTADLDTTAPDYRAPTNSCVRCWTARYIIHIDHVHTVYTVYPGRHGRRSHRRAPSIRREVSAHSCNPRFNRRSYSCPLDRCSRCVSTDSFQFDSSRVLCRFPHARMSTCLALGTPSSAVSVHAIPSRDSLISVSISRNRVAGTFGETASTTSRQSE
jgi:hypothetical protein